MNGYALVFGDLTIDLFRYGKVDLGSLNGKAGGKRCIEGSGSSCEEDHLVFQLWNRCFHCSIPMARVA